MRSTALFGLLFVSWLAAVPALAQNDRDAAIARENEQREAMQNGMIAVVDAVNMGSFGLLVGAIEQGPASGSWNRDGHHGAPPYCSF